MRTIESRIRKIKNRLGIKETPRILIIEMHDHKQRCKEYGLPFDLEQWITYKQAKTMKLLLPDYIYYFLQISLGKLNIWTQIKHVFNY